MENLIELVDALPRPEPPAQDQAAAARPAHGAAAALMRQSQIPDFSVPLLSPAFASPAMGQSFGWEVCAACDVPTEEIAERATEVMCPRCGQVFQRLSEDEKPVYGSGDVPSARPAPPLRVVGGQAGLHQKRIDKVSVTDTRESACSDILSELQVYNHEYACETGTAVSNDILREVAAIYVNTVRGMRVVRAQNKQAILAKLIEVISKKRGAPRMAADFAKMMHLRNKGLARGEMRMREMSACTDLLNAEQVTPWMRSALQSMGLVYDAYKPPCGELSTAERKAVLSSPDEERLVEAMFAAANELITVGETRRLGVNLQARTRAIGAIYVVLRRAAIAGALPAHWGFSTAEQADGGVPGSIEWTAAKCGIRVQTMRGYIEHLHDYHRSTYEAVYKKYGLWPGAQARL